MEPSLGADAKRELEVVAKKILVLCIPWQSAWAVSGGHIAESKSGSRATRKITETDDLGREILSYVSLPLMADFMSNAGQSLVSQARIPSSRTNNPNDPQVSKTMSTARSSHVNRLRGCASLIFGPEFDQNWFITKFDRQSVEKLQELLGVQPTGQGRKYSLLPPILYPNSSMKKKDLFLNPALVNVSNPSYHVCYVVYQR